VERERDPENIWLEGGKGLGCRAKGEEFQDIGEARNWNTKEKIGKQLTRGGKESVGGADKGGGGRV